MTKITEYAELNLDKESIIRKQKKLIDNFRNDSAKKRIAFTIEGIACAEQNKSKNNYVEIIINICREGRNKEIKNQTMSYHVY